jgi:hypothetical protein
MISLALPQASPCPAGAPSLASSRHFKADLMTSAIAMGMRSLLSAESMRAMVAAPIGAYLAPDFEPPFKR